MHWSRRDRRYDSPVRQNRGKASSVGNELRVLLRTGCKRLAWTVRDVSRA
jgi:hypothetical protein